VNEELEKDVTGSGRVQISKYYPDICLDCGKPLKPKSGQPVSGPRFKPRTSGIRSRSVNHLTTAFGM
jgi:hypothetical protein